MEAQRVGQQPGGARRRHVDHDVQRHHSAFSRLQHAGIPSGERVLGERAHALLEALACGALRPWPGAQVYQSARDPEKRRPRAAPRAVGSWKTRPVRPCSTLSAPPPSPKTIAGPAAGERLERHDADVLDAGHQHRAAAAVELAQLEVADVAEELDLGRRLRAKPRGLRPAADDPQRPPGAAVGLEARARAACRARAPRRRGRSCPARRAPGVKKPVSTGGGITAESRP